MAMDKKIVIKKISGYSFQSLIARLKKIKNTNDIEYIVFKVDKAIKRHLEEDSKDRDQILKRAQGVDVFLLISKKNFSKALFRINTNSCEPIHDQSRIEEIRHADFLDVLQRSDGKCLHIAGNGVHYQTPSGKHTKTFLRLADVVHSFGRLERVSYWLLEELNKVDAMLVDNWSLASIILYSQILLKKKIKFDCLHQHLNFDKEDALKVSKRLLKNLRADDTVLLLVSVNTSGRHYTSLINMCKKEVRPDLNYISASVYEMPCNSKIIAHPDKTFCKLKSSEMTAYSEQDCPYCKDAKESLLYIDERYYYPKPKNENCIQLPAKYVRKGSRIRPHLNLIGPIDGALCVHRDDPNDEQTPRHHAFYVDVVKLTEASSFKRKFSKKLEQLKNDQGVPDAIIYPPHSAAKKLLEVIPDNWKSRKIASHRLKSDLANEDKEYFKSCRHICILDDVIITGGRIERYVEDMRTELKSNISVLKKLSVMVAVQRVESEHCIKKLKDGALSEEHEWQSELYAVAELFLPNWDEESCPWCREAKIWADASYSNPFDQPSYFNSRMAELNPHNALGITSSPIPKFRPDIAWSLGAGSPLGREGIGEMHLLFTIAVALQMMRFDENPKKRLAKTDLINNALACGKEKSMFKRYGEPLIQACLLRCTKPSEWSDDMLKVGIPGLIENLSDKGTHVLLLEIMLYLKYRSFWESDLIEKLTGFFRGYVEDGTQDPALSVLNSLRMEDLPSGKD